MSHQRVIGEFPTSGKSPRTKDRQRRPASPAGTLSVYSGRTLLGTMRRRDRMVEAYDASGKGLGVFPSQLAACRAIGGSTDPPQENARRMRPRRAISNLSKLSKRKGPYHV
jgi:hypothetical protein